LMLTLVIATPTLTIGIPSAHYSYTTNKLPAGPFLNYFSVFLFFFFLWTYMAHRAVVTWVLSVSRKTHSTCAFHFRTCSYAYALYYETWTFSYIVA
jgi:hypothetical protein